MKESNKQSAQDSNKESINQSTQFNNGDYFPAEQEKKLEPTKPIDYILFIIIGAVVCFFNMFLNDYLNTHSSYEYIQIISYLIIIFMAMIPGIIFATSKRPRGYGYFIGYVIGGFIEAFTGDPYIGLYTSFVSTMLLIIPYMVFKRWRSVQRIKFE